MRRCSDVCLEQAVGYRVVVHLWHVPYHFRITGSRERKQYVKNAYDAMGHPQLLLFTHLDLRMDDRPSQSAGKKCVGMVSSIFGSPSPNLIFVHFISPKEAQGVSPSIFSLSQVDLSPLEKSTESSFSET